MFCILDQVSPTAGYLGLGTTQETDLNDVLARAGSVDSVLLFSGGRDSTLAAVELASRGKRLALVTLTSEHLIGSERILQRLDELGQYLPPSTLWVRLRQPRIPLSIVCLRKDTCLPCQRTYVTTAIAIARKLHCREIATGYTTYQSMWPEQTPYAISVLHRLLDAEGINVRVPVYGLRSKDEAKAKLLALGLNQEALEQKCLKQQWNSSLPDNILKDEIDRWGHGILEEMDTLTTFCFQLLDWRLTDNGRC